MIPLWIADMDFPTAQPIIDAAVRRAQEGIWGYTSRPKSYFEAVCAWQAAAPRLEPRPGRSAPTPWAWCRRWRRWCGSSQSLMRRCSSSRRSTASLAEVTEFQGRELVRNPLIETAPGKWEVDWADLERKLQEAKLFLFCSPHNPLGIVWSREDLMRMMELCRKYGVLVVSDEIHADLVFRGTHIPTASLSPEIAANTITCISGTKTFNLAGLHASTTVFPNLEMKKRFDDFWMSFDIHRNNAFSLVAMEAAFREGDEWLDQLLSYLDGNLHYIKEYLDVNIPEIKTFLPDATYLMWLDCRAMGLSQDALADFMIHKAGLGLSNGKAFDPSLTGFMRLNVACPRSVLEQAMGQLKRAVDAWREEGR